MIKKEMENERDNEDKEIIGEIRETEVAKEDIEVIEEIEGIEWIGWLVGRGRLRTVTETQCSTKYESVTALRHKRYRRRDIKTCSERSTFKNSAQRRYTKSQ